MTEWLHKKNNHALVNYNYDSFKYDIKDRNYKKLSNKYEIKSLNDEILSQLWDKKSTYWNTKSIMRLTFDIFMTVYIIMS